MRDQVIKIIANQIGVESQDIEEDDSLRNELHMSSLDVAEISEQFSLLGLDSIDWSEVETVGELLDALGADL